MVQVDLAPPSLAFHSSEIPRRERSPSNSARVLECATERDSGFFFRETWERGRSGPPFDVCGGKLGLA